MISKSDKCSEKNNERIVTEKIRKKGRDCLREGGQIRNGILRVELYQGAEYMEAWENASAEERSQYSHMEEGGILQCSRIHKIAR